MIPGVLELFQVGRADGALLTFVFGAACWLWACRSWRHDPLRNLSLQWFHLASLPRPTPRWDLQDLNRRYSAGTGRLRLE